LQGAALCRVRATCIVHAVYYILQHTKPMRQQSQNVSSAQWRARCTIQPRLQQQKADKHAIPHSSRPWACSEARPTRPSQHPNRRPRQEIIIPHQSNTQFAQGTINKRGPRNAPRARSLFAQRVQKIPYAIAPRDLSGHYACADATPCVRWP
jgi:hypothetical protein